MSNNRAPGPDGVPAEYWKALAEDCDALRQLADFCSFCWNRNEMPSEWHVAQVSAIHKKGRTDSCENYRPISLLNVSYKLFAALLHRRLVEAGAEERLSKSQFGFRSGHGSQSMLLLALRN